MSSVPVPDVPESEKVWTFKCMADFVGRHGHGSVSASTISRRHAAGLFVIEHKGRMVPVAYHSKLSGWWAPKEFLLQWAKAQNEAREAPATPERERRAS
jgi:hypothetical protein